jgi:hypothetical protein
MHLGDSYAALGDTTAARRAWLAALPCLDAIRHPDADAVRVRLGLPAGD